jgi:endonuclease III
MRPFSTCYTSNVGCEMKEAREFSIEELIEAVGGRFSVALGIDLESRNSKEIFKWFLAAILFGARIGESIAIRTYQEFVKRGVTTPQAILSTGWDGLVEILDAGGYVRYDFKTATKLLEIADKLEREYQGDLNLLHDGAKDSQDLERQLLEFKGIGPVTANIFLRELRGTWEKAEPLPSDLALLAAQNLGLIETGEPSQALARLKNIFQGDLASRQSYRYPKVGHRFSDFESALVRLGKGWCRKMKCTKCPMRAHCHKVVI